MQPNEVASGRYRIRLRVGRGEDGGMGGEGRRKLEATRCSVAEDLNQAQGNEDSLKHEKSVIHMRRKRKKMDKFIGGSGRKREGRNRDRNKKRKQKKEGNKKKRE